MGMISDFVASSKSIDTTLPTTALDRSVNRDLDVLIAKGDIVSPGATFDVVNEVQTLDASGASAGTFAMTIGVFNDGVNKQVAVTGVAYNASPATIETAVDSALGAVITGWTNGDISVSGAGTAEANDTLFTYDGASVSALAHPTSTVDGAGLTGGGTEAFSETNAGQTQRAEWAIMDKFSLVDFGGTPPAQTGALPTLTKIIDKSVQNDFSYETLRTIALECAIKDRIPGLEAALLDAFGVA